MILTAGSPEALSFTDDTSLQDAGAKVSIHAQVLREPPPNWFYALLQRAPGRADELKSSVIAEVFFSLPGYERRRVMATLKAVRIHITDPRPYTHDVNQVPYGSCSEVALPWQEMFSAVAGWTPPDRSLRRLSH